MSEKPNSVTQITTGLKELIQGTKIYVVGEVSNFSCKNGHRYFSLKDDGATIKCIIWKSISLPVEPENGDLLICKGKLDVYLPHGSYQIIISSCKIDGEGDLNAQFKKLHLKLLNQGYFEPTIKKPIPTSIKTIILITSLEGAVIKDIFSVIQRRNPTINLLVAEATMQGNACSETVCEALNKISKWNENNISQRADLVIICRGGGSKEDLWGFNSEQLVKKIFNFKDCPIISAVGHETDTTLCDYAADIRAATPTAAAELATRTICSKEMIENLFVNAYNLLNRKLESYETNLSLAKKTIDNFSPKTHLSIAEDRLSILMDKSSSIINKSISNCKINLSNLMCKINQLNPTPEPLPARPIFIDSRGKYVESLERLKNIANKKREITIKFIDGEITINPEVFFPK